MPTLVPLDLTCANAPVAFGASAWTSVLNTCSRRRSWASCQPEDTGVHTCMYTCTHTHIVTIDAEPAREPETTSTSASEQLRGRTGVYEHEDPTGACPLNRALRTPGRTERPWAPTRMLQLRKLRPKEIKRHAQATPAVIAQDLELWGPISYPVTLSCLSFSKTPDPSPVVLPRPQLLGPL